MAVNYSDDRLVAVEQAENKATTEVNKTYNDMIEQSDKMYQSQIDASKDWADKQSALQQQQTDFAIEKIEQEKAQKEKDYLREQSGAYVDWQKQSNKYGANAEAMASQGLTNTGYAESSQVSMYNTYQNRIVAARESHEIAKMNFANMIKDAQLQNSSALAEIALKAYEQQAQLSIQMVTTKNQLLAQKLEAKQQTHQIYRQQYQDVLDQINKERQEAIQKAQFDREMALKEQAFELEKQMYEDSKKAYTFSGGSSGSKGSSGGSGDNTKINKNSSTNKNETIGKPKADNNKYGNSSATQKKSDYYFSNGYQPRYVNNMKLAKTGDKVIVNGREQNLWQTSDGKLWAWDGSTRTYVTAQRSSKQGGMSSFAMQQIKDSKKK